MKPYKLHVPRPKKHNDAPLNRLEPQKTEEGLTGYVGEWEASDIEERFARSLSKAGFGYSFREHFFGPTRTTPGAVEVDFLVFVGAETYPIQIDGAYAHRSSAQKTNDSIKDALFNKFGSSHGFNPVERIDGELIETQDEADVVVKELFR